MPSSSIDSPNSSQQSANASTAETEAKLQLAMDCADLGTWSYDTASQLFVADERMARMFGVDTPKAPLSYWQKLLHPDDREHAEKSFERALAGEETYDVEYRLCRPDGERWIRSKGRVTDGSPKRMLAIVEDITSRKRAEEELRISEEGMRLSQEAAGIASWDWNLKTDQMKWHPKGTHVYGRPADQLKDGATIFGFLYEEDREKVREALKPAFDGSGEFQADFWVFWPDGSTHWLIGRGQPIKAEGGKVTRIVGVNMDVTSRRDAEFAARQTEKLAAVGRLASSIAHEINNPLASVTNLLYLLRSQDLNEIHEYAEVAERELRRVSLIANQTLKFRKQATKAEACECADLIGESLALVQGRLVNRRITVEKRKRANQPVICHGDEIRQVLGNLISNAIDSMPFGGRLLVRSRNGCDWKTDRSGIVLTVADTGIGMSSATKRKIFEAFFTTKGIGGTGLGLWLSCEIAARHRGALRVRSSEKEGSSGTVFTLFLPFKNPESNDAREQKSASTISES